MYMQKEVEAGIEVLDSIRPDWREHINTDILDMCCLDNCILGQVIGNDNIPYCTTDLVVSYISEYGFDILEEDLDDPVIRDEAYQKLKETWLYYLN